MTEKKYMTASEYFRNEIPLRVKIYMDEFNKSKLVLEKLDTHFINKDLLKDKINIAYNKGYDEGYKEGREKLRKEILELLK